MKKMTQLTALLLALSLVGVGCAKKRDAALPDGATDNIFAISDFGAIPGDEGAAFSLKTRDEAMVLSEGERSKAMNEKGRVQVDPSTLSVPSRLKFMFENLEIQGVPGRQYSVAFAVDRDFVTAYKIVNRPDEMSMLEKAVASTAKQIQSELELQKTRETNKLSALQSQIRNLRKESRQALDAGKTGQYLIPLFKYRISTYGVLERVKNDLREETATLRLRPTEWASATHLQMSHITADRLPVDVEPQRREDLEQLYVMNRINNKIMTAGQLKTDFLVTTNLEDDTKILTLLDPDSLILFEITTESRANLTDADREILRNNVRNGQVMRCSDEVKMALPEADRAGCLLIRRYEYPVTYVRPELPEVSYEGSRTNSLYLRPVKAQENVGLVRISKDSVGRSILTDGKLDPRRTVRKSDLLGKEFFFRRTMERNSLTNQLPVGWGGPLLPVKFVLEDTRVVVKRTESVVQFPHLGQTDMDQEEVMSFSATYLRERLTDDAGNRLTIPRFEETTKDKADYIQIDWTRNQMPSIYSPLAYYSAGYCLRNTHNEEVKDLDLRLNEGILNFSIQSSTTMPEECLSAFMTWQDYGWFAEPVAHSQQVRERISFRVNDGSFDKPFAPQVPFMAMKALGYGLFSVGKLNPSATGETGRDGQEITFPLTHDFRNGKKLIYVIGGLPDSSTSKFDHEGESFDLRDLHIEVSKEVVADWNEALHKAFKGTSLARPEGQNYIEVVVNGENGVNARLGDLDKNFIWFDEGLSGGLGVAQPAANPRNGLVVADHHIIYSANARQYLDYYRRNMKIVSAHQERLRKIREEALKNMAAEAEAEQQQQSNPGAAVSGDPAVDAAKREVFRKQINSVLDLVGGGSRVTQNQGLPQVSLPKSNILASKPGLQNRHERLKKAFEQVLEMNPVDRKVGNGAYLKQFARKSLDLGPGASHDDYALLAAKEVLAAVGNSSHISELDKRALRAQVRALENKQRLQALLIKQGSCLNEAPLTVAENFIKVSYRDGLKAMLKGTLAHEMGHSLGLTHNFIASADPANFYFPGQKEAGEKSVASSVMDYLTPDAEIGSTTKPGPYDVHAIRAGYTGMIELNNGQMIHVDKVREHLGGSWLRLNRGRIAQLPIKAYKYCPDTEVGWEAVCQRHDTGSTADEIVDNLIRYYDELYVTAHHDYDRQRFGWRAKSSVLGRSFYYGLQIRGFFDEFLYKAIFNEGTEEELQQHAQAAFRGYKHFLAVIGNPDHQGSYQDPSRFVPVQYVYEEPKLGADGKPIMGADGRPVMEEKKDIHVVEKKAVLDRLSEPDRLDTIGYELNKLFALDLITLKRYPHPKYRMASMAFSYVEFEKFMLRINNPAQSPIFVTMTSMLKDDLRPHLTNDKVFFEALPSDLTTEVTALLKAYAAINAIIGLEAFTLKDSDNSANLFKVRALTGAPPSDRISLTQLAAAANSTQKVNYFAHDGASIANALVLEGSRHQFYIQNQEAISQKMAGLLKAQLQLASAKPSETDADQQQLFNTRSQEVAQAKKDLADALKAMGATQSLLLTQQIPAFAENTVEKVVDLVARMNEQLYIQPQVQNFYMNLAVIKAQVSQNPDLRRHPQVIQILGLEAALKGDNTDMTRIVPIMSLTQTVLKTSSAATAEQALQAFQAFQQSLNGRTPTEQEKAQLEALRKVALQAKANADGLTSISAEVDFEERYGLMLTTLEFLHEITIVVSPELAR